MHKTILDDYIYDLSLNKAKLLEQRISIVLKPKPRYLPKAIWLWLAKQLIYIQEHQL